MLIKTRYMILTLEIGSIHLNDKIQPNEPSCISFQNEFIHLCKSMYNLMTGDPNDESLFRSLTTSSTILLKTGSLILLNLIS